MNKKDVKKEELDQLTSEIMRADYEYYVLDSPTLTDKEYDDKIARLQTLEAYMKDAYGYENPLSPLRHVSGAVGAGFQSVKHSAPMLSAQKTKCVDELVRFAGGKPVVLSWKADGLTLVCRYDENGDLVAAITRGNSEYGEDVLCSAKYIPNLPHKIDADEPVEVRGEVVIPWEVFRTQEDEFSHPRNQAAGTLRSMTVDIKRCSMLRFIAFEAVSGIDADTKTDSLDILSYLGFDAVDHVLIRDPENKLEEKMGAFDPLTYKYPVDGLMVEYDDLAYGASLGVTGHHARCRMAFKWADEVEETTLRSIEAATTKTGMISLTAIFDTVVLDGTNVSRAYVHNVDRIRKLGLGIGDTIKVYKANQIIPQIAEDVQQSGNLTLPTTCPCCGSPIEERTSSGGVRSLYCTNNKCPARMVQRFSAFADRTRMDIDGLSDKTLEALAGTGLLRNLGDVYHLKDHEEEIVKIPGFGKRSFMKMCKSIDKSKSTTMAKVISGFCIPNVGRHGAKLIAEKFDNKWDDFVAALQRGDDFSISIKGVGDVFNNSLHAWYKDPDERAFCMPLVSEVSMTEPQKKQAPVPPSMQNSANLQNLFQGKEVVATGTMNDAYGNKIYDRNGINAALSSLGAYVADKVTYRTDIVLVGDKPGSVKYNEAKKLGIKIMPFSDFLAMQ